MNANISVSSSHLFSKSLFLYCTDNEAGKIEDTQMIEETQPNQPEETKESADSQILSQGHHMELLWKEKSFTDVTFVVQNEEIPAHRAILLKSRYFQNLLKSTFDYFSLE